MITLFSEDSEMYQQEAKVISTKFHQAIWPVLQEIIEEYGDDISIRSLEYIAGHAVVSVFAGELVRKMVRIEKAKREEK